MRINGDEDAPRPGEIATPERLLRSLTAVVLALCLARAVYCGKRAPNIKIEEVAHYSLGAAEKEYGAPLTGFVPFDMSRDGKRLVAKIWIRGVEGCGQIPNCGAYVLGIFDVSSGKLIAHTVGRESYEPSFAFFLRGGSEVVSNFGPDVVILKTADLSVAYRPEMQEKGKEPSSKIVSAAISTDGNFLGVLHFFSAPHPSANTMGRATFGLYDLNRPEALADCILATRIEYPSFRVALAPDKRSFLANLANPTGARGLGEYDSSTCALERSWSVADIPTRGQFSPDGSYIAVVFGGTYPKRKLAVFSRGGEESIWTLQAHSINDMEWPVSISPDSRLLAISSDRYGESWLDAFAEASHINEPGIEIRELSTGRSIGRAVFARRTRSGVFGTTLVQFLSSSEIAAVAPGPEVRLYKLLQGR